MMTASRMIKSPVRYPAVIPFFSINMNTTPAKPSRMPKNLRLVIRSPGMKKCARNRIKKGSKFESKVPREALDLLSPR